MSFFCFQSKTIVSKVLCKSLDTIDEVDPNSLQVPTNEFDGKVVYGEKNLQANKVLTGHYREMLPTLSMLKTMEKTAQSSFITLSQRKPGLIQHW